MFVAIRRRKRGDKTYEYVDIVENRKVADKVKHDVLGSLGRRDQLPPQEVDRLIEHLRKLASPEGLRGIQLGEMEIRAVREYGITLVAHQQRRHDGVFLLETNHPQLSTDEVVASYRQLMEVERAFRVLKFLVKLRPIYHHRDRRVETHVFICFLAYLLAKLIEQRLRAAGLTISIAHALDSLSQLKAVEHTWEGQAVVVKATKPDPEVEAILQALGIRVGNRVLSDSPLPAA